MQPRVTAILIARNGAAQLTRTLDALRAQTRPPERLVAVDLASHDGTAQLLADGGVAQVVASRGGSFGDGAAQALRLAAADPQPEEWLWLLGHDAAPEPDALRALLGAVEIAPSVAVAGPKVMRSDAPHVIASFGETLSGLGASVHLVEDELDQAQHDVQSDVLGIAAQGMLVRRDVWEALGGFDPGLPDADAGLDLAVRARLAGHRVIVVPAAKVQRSAAPEDFGRAPGSSNRRRRKARRAQLHRRLVYSPALMLPLHWLSLLPLALLRSLGHLLAKRPLAVPGEFAAAFTAAFGDPGVVGARRRLRRAKQLPWSSVDSLRMPWPELRERRAAERQAREARLAAADPLDVAPIGFLPGGGLWALLIGAAIGVVVAFPLFGGVAAVGGGLLPLASSPAELWRAALGGWLQDGNGVAGPADPFAVLVALLGSATFWQPSLSIVVLLAAAPALAALSAWFLLRAVSRRSWIPALGAVVYSVSPPLLASILEGRLGAVIALALLPWLLLAAIRSIRSWTGLGAAALLGAVVVAASPSLAPPLLIAWLALVLLRPARALRLVFMPLPALGVLAPLAVAQFLRGTPLAVLADPGAVQATDAVDGWRLALASADGALHGWPAVAESFGFSASLGGIVAIALLAPLLLLGLLGPFLPGAARTLPALLLAVLGFAAAVGAGLLRVSAVDDGVAALWPGAALGLLVLGLLIAAAGTLDALGRGAAVPGLALLLGALLLAVPQLGGLYADDAAVRAGNGRVLPAVVTAESDLEPQVGTLVLTPQTDGSLRARLERGRGHGLEDASTFAVTARDASERDEALAELAGNIASRGGYDPAPVLREFGIDFIVLAPIAAEGEDAAGGAAVSTRAQQALDGSADFSMIGSSEAGLLWRTTVDGIDPSTAPAAQEELSAVVASPLRDAGLVLLALAALLAVPTRLGSPRVRESRHIEDEAEYTFGEEGEQDD